MKHLVLFVPNLFLQIVVVNNARRKATVKLIPRIDLQAVAAKFVIRSSYLMISNIFFISAGHLLAVLVAHYYHLGIILHLVLHHTI